MTSERATAYGHLIRSLAGMDPAVPAAEADRLRAAADTLVLAREANPVAQAALEDAEEVGRLLVAARICDRAAADALLERLAACGPQPARALLAPSLQ